MPYPQHWYVAFGGTSFGGTEEWQCGIRMAGGDPVAGGDLDPFVADVAADVKKFFLTSAAKATNYHTLEYCKFNKIGPDGTYVDKTESHTFIYSPVPTGLVGTHQLPQQAAVAISLLTDAARGPAHRGRFYWLAGGFGVSTTVDGPTMVNSERDALAAAAKTLMVDLANWPGLDISGLAPAVVSARGSGSWRHVTAIEVGSRFDTQRRRAKKQAETYAHVDV